MCGGENDKDRKNELGKQERLRVQKQTARGEVSQRAGSNKRGEETADVMANHFPSNRVGNSSLMQRHQGNGWCGADMLLCRDMLV